VEVRRRKTRPARVESEPVGRLGKVPKGGDPGRETGLVEPRKAQRAGCGERGLEFGRGRDDCEVAGCSRAPGNGGRPDELRCYSG